MTSYAEKTDRKQREEELESIIDQTKYALDASDITIWFCDPESGAIDTPYRPVEEIVGIENERFDDVKEFFDFAVHPKDREKVSEAYQSIVEGDTNQLDLEFRIHPDVGENRWLWLNGCLRTDSDQEKLVWLMSDVSEQKGREQQLKRQKERLESFTGVVSHDLRNPLSVASGRIKLANMELDNEHIHIAERAIERMETLISDLLTLAKKGDLLGEQEPVELRSVIEDSWQSVDIGDGTLKIKTSRHVLADRSRLQQLLENLFRNAIEHGERDPTIIIGDTDTGFYIEDDGPGIPPDERQHVFDVGYSSTETGTGFGLSIVEEIAGAHGWTTDVVSGTGGGARFEFACVEYAKINDETSCSCH